MNAQETELFCKVLKIRLEDSDNKSFKIELLKMIGNERIKVGEALPDLNYIYRNIKYDISDILVDITDLVNIGVLEEFNSEIVKISKLTSIGILVDFNSDGVLEDVNPEVANTFIQFMRPNLGFKIASKEKADFILHQIYLTKLENCYDDLMSVKVPHEKILDKMLFLECNSRASEILAERLLEKEPQDRGYSSGEDTFEKVYKNADARFKRLEVLFNDLKDTTDLKITRLAEDMQNEEE